MRTITSQEQAAVVGGIDSVNVPAKKKDDGAASAALQMSISNSGANSAGSAGGVGGSGKQTITTCVDTVTQVSQTGGPSEMSFGVQGVSLRQVPKIESVTKTSKCTSVTTQRSQ
ncbi:hypothetical protein GTP45_05480 [Pseudoduganella sp. FT55W]|uniref:Uncharacterized protein n=1 Tax=Duganella rivi TaxID=2666083 RepID=A0A7X4GPI6_9BURK|nr:hypothetical protein [Duganella rivi]MYM66287.1 hypothetical protein [Duganella rivi]